MDWTPVVVLLGSIFALTSLGTFFIRRRLKGSIRIAVASILGIFAGVSGASHGLGEILQGNIAPSGIVVEAWPQLTLLVGEPAMTVIPNLIVTGVFAIASGLTVALWSAARIQRKNGALILIMLSILMLLVGGGLLPPVIGVIAGIIGTRTKPREDKRKRIGGGTDQLSKRDIS